MASEQETIFIQWLDAYKGLIYKVARAFTYSADEMEDLFQDILLQLWISAANFKHNAGESTWVYRVAFNTAVVWDRKRKKHRKLKSVLLAQRPAEAQATDKNEQIESLYAAIRKLDKLDASLVMMSLDGLSYQQIAEVTGLSESNVGVKLNRARKRLGDLLKGADDEF